MSLWNQTYEVGGVTYIHFSKLHYIYTKKQLDFIRYMLEGDHEMGRPTAKQMEYWNAMVEIAESELKRQGLRNVLINYTR